MKSTQHSNLLLHLYHQKEIVHKLDKRTPLHSNQQYHVQKYNEAFLVFPFYRAVQAFLRLHIPSNLYKKKLGLDKFSFALPIPTDGKYPKSLH